MKKAPYFSSDREQLYWIWVLIVVLVILSSLFLGKPLSEQLRDQNVQAIIFVAGMIFIAAAVIAHGIRMRPGKIEWVLILGIVAVYTLLIFRLGAPERSHLMEYSVLAIFTHNALLERKKHDKLQGSPAFLALVISFFFGVADELLQLLIPDRVFDFEDIVFNGLSILLALTASVALFWIRKRYKK